MSISSSVSMCSDTKEMGTASRERHPPAPSSLRGGAGAASHAGGWVGGQRGVSGADAAAGSWPINLPGPASSAPLQPPSPAPYAVVGVGLEPLHRADARLVRQRVGVVAPPPLELAHDQGDTLLLQGAGPSTGGYGRQQSACVAQAGRRPLQPASWSRCSPQHSALPVRSRARATPHTPTPHVSPPGSPRTISSL